MYCVWKYVWKARKSVKDDDNEGKVEKDNEGITICFVFTNSIFVFQDEVEDIMLCWSVVYFVVYFRGNVNRNSSFRRLQQSPWIPVKRVQNQKRGRMFTTLKMPTLMDTKSSVLDSLNLTVVPGEKPTVPCLEVTQCYPTPLVLPRIKVFRAICIRPYHKTLTLEESSYTSAIAGERIHVSMSFCYRMLHRGIWDWYIVEFELSRGLPLPCINCGSYTHPSQVQHECIMVEDEAGMCFCHHGHSGKHGGLEESIAVFDNRSSDGQPRRYDGVNWLRNVLHDTGMKEN